MVTPIMKTIFPAKVIKRCDYIYIYIYFFCTDTFMEFLRNIFSQNLKNNCDDHYNNFAISCKNIFDKIAAWKKSYVWGYHLPFMKKALSKAIW